MSEDKPWPCSPKLFPEGFITEEMHGRVANMPCVWTSIVDWSSRNLENARLIDGWLMSKYPYSSFTKDRCEAMFKGELYQTIVWC